MKSTPLNRTGGRVLPGSAPKAANLVERTEYAEPAVPVPAGEIPAALDNLHSAIDEAGALLGDVVERLHSVLSQAPTKNNETQEANPGQCLLATSINCATGNVMDLVAGLRLLRANLRL